MKTHQKLITAIHEAVLRTLKGGLIGGLLGLLLGAALLYELTHPTEATGFENYMHTDAWQLPLITAIPGAALGAFVVFTMPFWKSWW